MKCILCDKGFPARSGPGWIPRFTEFEDPQQPGQAILKAKFSAATALARQARKSHV